ncbi:hypothetical protein [Polaromonas sp. SM01]|uniref:hypothetical protein n=1 Tax=Polaromonas sp. SM01 TaxID=3085630 RepID=UPI0029812688|nr:hypothetical protein [Polaromonas sp. SM01]MDW5442317.1 hypothetical protein [Polaromonas sp. SM01]
MKRLTLLIPALFVVAGLSACGEKPQTLSGTKSDVPAYMGTNDGFSAPGWKAGDKTSWEQGLKVRMQNSQNEYTKLNTDK